MDKPQWAKDYEAAYMARYDHDCEVVSVSPGWWRIVTNGWPSELHRRKEIEQMTLKLAARARRGRQG
jgi:hypothetical protein